ncbi:MAG: T9SS type A sorting domain-containing protein [Chloroherpetonaceae bacterium]
MHIIYRFLLASFLTATSSPLVAQFGFSPTNVQNTLRSYIDIDQSGTVINTTGFNNVNSAPVNIGFPFVFNGVTYTQFILNSNGFIKLGALPPSSASLFPSGPGGLGSAIASANLRDTAIISGFNAGLRAAQPTTGFTPTPEFRVFTTGLAGSRVCIIQFKNLAETASLGFISLDFQIRLYETSNDVEIIFGTWILNTASAPNFRVSIGIKGRNTSQVVTAENTINVATTFGTSATATVLLSGVGAPWNPGRSFRFFQSTPPPTNDAAIEAVYTLTRAPGFFAAPLPIQALVRNTGPVPITNLPVTLTISGVNSFTNTQVIASLPVNARRIVDFPNYTPINIGFNFVTVSVPSDANINNNSQTITQDISSNTFSYLDANPASGQVGFGTGSGLLLTRFRLSGSNKISQVRVFISADPNSVGKNVYAVLLGANGQRLDTSATLTIQNTMLNQFFTFDLTNLPTLTNTDFYVGLAQTASPTAYFPLGTQTENPARPDRYYSATLNGGEVPTAVTDLNRFMIEAILFTQVPVELTSFTATKNIDRILLTWTTASEQNNSGFEVERKSAGATWNTLGFVRGNGTTTEAKSYSFIDRTATGKVQYRLKQIDFDGQFEYSPIIEVDAGLPKTFELSQNYPNPFNPTTIINYQLPTASTVLLKVYDVLGKEVATLVNARQEAGTYNFNFNASNLASGVYFYRLQASATNGASGSNFVETKKMMLVK